MELFGPRGCSLKHGNAYSYLPDALALCEDGHQCKAFQDLAGFAVSDLVCGEEVCYPACAAVLAKACAACASGHISPCFHEEPCCDPAGLTAENNSAWTADSVWVHGGRCGNTCARVAGAGMRRRFIRADSDALGAALSLLLTATASSAAQQRHATPDADIDGGPRSHRALHVQRARMRLAPNASKPKHVDWETGMREREDRERHVRNQRRADDR